MGITDRVIILIDMDCFYCQVEENLNPKLAGKPIAVVQYNQWRGGGIIAVNYPARDEGVTRHMRGFDARKQCPRINLVSVPEVRGKADLTKYRDAGKVVADVLATFTPLLERASVDEAYLDITAEVETRIYSSLDDLKSENLANTFVVGTDTDTFIYNVLSNRDMLEADLKLAVGGLICEEIRLEVFRKTGYKCSAGIAHNKTLAKLVCSLHKPNKQTILPHGAVEEFFKTMPIKKIRSLGGKFGQTLSEDLGINYMGELAKFSERELQLKYDDKNGSWLFHVARGIDLDPVTTKLISKSIGSCKNFRGNAALFKAEDVMHWLGELSEELSERLDKDLKENKRKSRQMVISFTQKIDKKFISNTRTHPLPSYDPNKIAQSTYEVIKKNCMKSDESFHVTFLGISVGNFEDTKNVREITSFFNKASFKASSDAEESSSKDDSSIFDLEISSEDSDDVNIFLQKTQELDENFNDLVFYDDNFRIKRDCHKVVNNENGGTVNVVAQSSPSCSFFKKYFKKNDKEESLNQAFETKTEQSADNEEQAEQSIHVKECPECNKRIFKTEFQSHQDYHFALNLMNEERKSGRGTPKVAENSKKKNPQQKSGLKRKSNELSTPESNILKNFFKKEVLSDSDLTEVCGECSRKVKVEDFASHLDYHAAKKLHLEINSVPVAVHNNCKNNMAGKKLSKNKSVVGYLKPL